MRSLCFELYSIWEICKVLSNQWRWEQIFTCPAVCKKRANRTLSTVAWLKLDVSSWLPLSSIMIEKWWYEDIRKVIVKQFYFPINGMRIWRKRGIDNKVRIVAGVRWFTAYGPWYKRDVKWDGRKKCKKTSEKVKNMWVGQESPHTSTTSKVFSRILCPHGPCLNLLCLYFFL